jgi:hypothetical protein
MHSQRTGGGNQPPRRLTTCHTSIALAVVLASAAWAAVDTDWIEHAGGTVARDAGGEPVAADLRASWVTDSDMPLLVQMKDLKRLDLSLTRISDRGMRALKTAPAIEELNLSFAEQITDEGAATVKNWKHLRRLNLRGTKITDATLEFLSGAASLEWLDIGWRRRSPIPASTTWLPSPICALTMGGNKLTAHLAALLPTVAQIEYLVWRHAAARTPACGRCN